MRDQDQLAQPIQDAQRFVMYPKGAIEGCSLQIYASALLFSPTGSLIRELFQHEETEGIKLGQLRTVARVHIYRRSRIIVTTLR